MSTIERDLATDLEEGERLKSLGIIDDEEILRDIDQVFEKRGAIRLREILFEVIDDGDVDGPWMFYHAFEPVADQQRTRFIDAVIKKVKRG